MSIRDFKGDFLSFTYRGIDSSSMKIVRISNGSRLEMSLFPKSNDRIISVTGRSEEFSLGVWHESRELAIEFAFDNLTQRDIRRLTHWLRNDTYGELYFAESSYKAWNARVIDDVVLQYVPFDNKTGEVIYKGEGSVTFRTSSGYAKGRFGSATEQEQWKATTGLNYPSTGYGSFTPQGVVKLYNTGDVTTPLKIRFQVSRASGYQSIILREKGSRIGEVVLDLSKLKVGVNYVLDAYSQTLYAQNTTQDLSSAIVAGDYLFLPSSITLNTSGGFSTVDHTITTNPAVETAITAVAVEYDPLFY